MQLDLKTQDFKPKRQTFSHLQRRFGEDRPASRYEEATYDIQADVNFHYRPTWAPEYELFDTSRTAIKMEDWYKLTDPRQYYYAVYNINRSKMYEAADRNFDFIENANLLASTAPEWLAKLKNFIVPLRHYEWGANNVNAGITAYGYGTALTQATCFAMGDRLGLAQLLSRIGLALNNNDPEVLDAGRDAWVGDEKWQGLRKLVEDALVIEDWFEAFVAQNVAMDAIVHGVAYDSLVHAGAQQGGSVAVMMVEFINDWRTEYTRWTDSILKTAAAESDENKATIQGWLNGYAEQAEKAMKPIAEYVADDGAGAVSAARDALNARMAKIGLA